MFQGLLVLMLLQGPAVGPAPMIQVTEPGAAVATFVPVCRDHRGAWDRRACHHGRRNDPSRLILARADAPAATGQASPHDAA